MSSLSTPSTTKAASECVRLCARTCLWVMLGWGCVCARTEVHTPILPARTHMHTPQHARTHELTHAPTLRYRQWIRAGPREALYFDPKTVVAGIVTCGGLCPGLNNVIQEHCLCLCMSCVCARARPRTFFLPVYVGVRRALSRLFCSAVDRGGGCWYSWHIFCVSSRADAGCAMCPPTVCRTQSWDVCMQAVTMTLLQSYGAKKVRQRGGRA